MKKKMSLIKLSNKQKEKVIAGIGGGDCGEFGCGCYCPASEACVPANAKNQNPDCVRIPPE